MGARGLLRDVVRAVRLGEGISWSISLVRSESESIYLAFDDVPDKCAELEGVVKFVGYPEGTCPLEP